MPALVNQPPLPHFANFIDGVAELIAAILDMHNGLAQRQIATVDVSYSGHCSLFPPLRGWGGGSDLNLFPAP
jgi:hypothetical protein